ncbi:uncharacterized protein LOC113352494 [Papaver somniferum]|uniref:uncharacterized protein LOC113352494 n=1 Tax=Papaver somniferum TaxID=3469 RepID=UPI000E6F684E|nr:uncharacterized protein LOC113352494 [Papaver somniferum]
MENKWNPPETEWTKLNTDTAFKDFKGGWAVAARNAEVKFTRCGTMSHKVLSVIEAETIAVLLAADFAVMSHLQRVIIDCDAEKVVNMLTKGDYHIPWRLHQIILQIRKHLKKVAEVKTVFIKKNGNNVAHALAKYALTRHSNMWWFSPKPPCCIRVLFARVYDAL